MSETVTIQIEILETTLDELKVMDSFRQILEHCALSDDELRRVIYWINAKYSPPIKVQPVVRPKNDQ